MSEEIKYCVCGVPLPPLCNKVQTHTCMCGKEWKVALVWKVEKMMEKPNKEKEDV